MSERKVGGRQAPSSSGNKSEVIRQILKLNREARTLLGRRVSFLRATAQSKERKLEADALELLLVWHDMALIKAPPGYMEKDEVER